MPDIGYATLPIIPSFKGLRGQLERGSARDMTAAGVSSGRKFGASAGGSAATGFRSKFTSVLRRGGGLVGLGAGFGVASFVKDSVELEAQFGKTMAQIGVATGVPKKRLAEMDALAIKLGKDTVFSASDASGAMLELAKNGITPAVIQGGALKSALTLAAAGGVDLTTAATTMGNALNAFNLKGRDARSVSAALAGAANASSASVGSLAEGLQQVSAVAADSGFTIQETTGALAAFANAGISGSDAGTTLKTALSRLVPQTEKAFDAMDQYGLVSFDAADATKILARDGIPQLGKSYDEVYKSVENFMVQQGLASKETPTKLAKVTKDYLKVSGIMRNDFLKKNGDYKSLAAISGELQKSFKGLSDSERGSALNTIFGSDARRAATVLMNEGEKGLRKYTRATSDQSQADKLAKANMSGTAGAIERLKGSWETAKLQFGKFIAPTVVKVLDAFSDGIDGAGPKLADLRKKVEPLTKSALPALNMGLKTARDVLEKLAPLAKGVFDAFNSLPKVAQQAILIGAGAGVLAKKTGVLGSKGGALGGSGLLGLVSKAKPIPVFVTNPGFGGGDIPGIPGKPGKTPGIPKGFDKAKPLLSFLSVLPAAGAAGNDTKMLTAPDSKLGKQYAAQIESAKRLAAFTDRTRQVLQKLPGDFDRGKNGAEALRSQVFGIETAARRSRGAVVSLVDELEKARRKAILVDQGVSAARSGKVEGQLGRGGISVGVMNVHGTSLPEVRRDAEHKGRARAHGAESFQ